jgi:hypothetical protein
MRIVSRSAITEEANRRAASSVDGSSSSTTMAFEDDFSQDSYRATICELSQSWLKVVFPNSPVMTIARTDVRALEDTRPCSSTFLMQSKPLSSEVDSIRPEL